MQKVDSRYKLVILAARRTMELNDGKQRLVDVPVTTKLPITALTEIATGKVTYRKIEEEKK